jgi:hypothetical protein
MIIGFSGQSAGEIEAISTVAQIMSAVVQITAKYGGTLSLPTSSIVPYTTGSAIVILSAGVYD